MALTLPTPAVSVVIVNYNVRHFLELCLDSLQQAAGEVAVEIIVIDNHSSDGSRQLLPEKFPSVRFVWNLGNSGFATACNQGWKLASGKWVLFLNPDTIVPENFFHLTLPFLESQKDLGATGVRMVDGSGNYLPESKRGFPTPEAAFFKITGLHKLFPGSRRFARYHLGHLDPRQIQEVDIISGACMFVSRKALLRTRGFDEDFFMYGEDIDLSYRLREAGLKNMYFPAVTIIHFKGESTQRDTHAYVRRFYKAMRIFIEKHYEEGGKKYLLGPMKLAIAVRGLASHCARLPSRLLKPRPRPVSNYAIAGDRESTEAAITIFRSACEEKNITTSLIVSEGEPREQLLAALESMDAGGIILCHGAISYGDMIACVERLGPKRRMYFMASPGRAIVSSISRKEQGTVWSLREARIDAVASKA